MSEPQDRATEPNDEAEETSPSSEPVEGASTPRDDASPEAADDEAPASADEGPELVSAEEEVERLREALARSRSELEAARGELKAMTERLRLVSGRYRELEESQKAFRARQEDRAAKERERRQAEVVKAFFEPVQNLQRSQDAPGDAASFRAGVKMVHQQFMDALHGLGLSRVPGAGQPFDPNLHEALHVVEVPSPELDGRVVEVYDEGWMVGGTAIKAAKVSVGKHVASDSPAEA